MLNSSTLSGDGWQVADPMVSEVIQRGNQKQYFGRNAGGSKRTASPREILTPMYQGGSNAYIKNAVTRQSRVVDLDGM